MCLCTCICHTYAWDFFVEKSDVPIGIENGLEREESQPSLVDHPQVRPLQGQGVLILPHLNMGVRGGTIVTRTKVALL